MDLRSACQSSLQRVSTHFQVKVQKRMCYALQSKTTHCVLNFTISTSVQALHISVSRDCFVKQVTHWHRLMQQGDHCSPLPSKGQCSQTKASEVFTLQLERSYTWKLTCENAARTAESYSCQSNAVCLLLTHTATSCPAPQRLQHLGYCLIPQNHTCWPVIQSNFRSIHAMCSVDTSCMM